MKNRVDVFLVHGVGKLLKADYYDNFVKAIRDELPIDFDLNFHPIDYSYLLQEKEETIFGWMKDMGWDKLREFGCNFVCDVLAYGYPKAKATQGDFVYDVTQLLDLKFNEVAKRYPESKKVIIGHSLGSIISFGYSWEFPINCLITLGSPFLYFSIRYKDFGKNNPNLPLFYNFWKYYDPISTKVSRNPNFSTVKDIQVKTFNPKYILPMQAHTNGYWKSNFVHKEIAKIISSLE